LVPIFTAVTVGIKKGYKMKGIIKKDSILGFEDKDKPVGKVAYDYIDGYTGDDLIQGYKMMVLFMARNMRIE
jgi:hypothetical protein